MTEFDLHQHPGGLFVIATLLPLAAFLAIFLSRGLWGAIRPYHNKPWARGLFRVLDGQPFQRAAAWVSVSAIAAACACSVTGFVIWEMEAHSFPDPTARHEIARSVGLEDDKVDQVLAEAARGTHKADIARAAKIDEKKVEDILARDAETTRGLEKVLHRHEARAEELRGQLHEGKDVRKE